MLQYTIRWYDAENHTLNFSSWARCTAVMSRLVRSGFKVELTFE